MDAPGHARAAERGRGRTCWDVPGRANLAARDVRGAGGAMSVTYEQIGMAAVVWQEWADDAKRAREARTEYLRWHRCSNPIIHGYDEGDTRSNCLGPDCAACAGSVPLHNTYRTLARKQAAAKGKLTRLIKKWHEQR